jgi:hypothetical protein
VKRYGEKVHWVHRPKYATDCMLLIAGESDNNHTSIYRRLTQIQKLGRHVFWWSNISPASATVLHVVRTGFCFVPICGRGHTLHRSRAQTTVPFTIPNFERMITSVRWRELPNFVAICFTEAAPHVGEIYSSRLFYLSSQFFFLFYQLVYRTQFAKDFDVWWLKRRVLA